MQNARAAVPVGERLGRWKDFYVRWKYGIGGCIATQRIVHLKH
jgi:hypothetical protein